MNRRNDILSYLGQTNSSHLHARAKRGTTVLIDSLDCNDGEEVLEIGPGTGATLVQLAGRHRKTNFCGVEYSKIMYQKALQRLRFCGLQRRVNLKLMEQRDRLPFADSAFDKVYVESVLAIQDGLALKRMLLEIKRVLKPDGMLAMNETIWIDSTLPSEAREINGICKRQFGIIQSNDHFPYLKDWKALLEELRFDVKSAGALDEIVLTIHHMAAESTRSRIFTFLGKVKGKLRPALVRELEEYQRAMKAILSQNRQLMAGYLIVARNLK